MVGGHVAAEAASLVFATRAQCAGAETSTGVGQKQMEPNRLGNAESHRGSSVKIKLMQRRFDTLLCNIVTAESTLTVCVRNWIRSDVGSSRVGVCVEVARFTYAGMSTMRGMTPPRMQSDDNERLVHSQLQNKRRGKVGTLQPWWT